ncbi:MAG TPA: hypothetical protein PLL78_11755, partial [Fimbriimonadaceae bacterium]|nr:hypothetical protein [Fimbriimonadaceae bacterium]
ETKSRSGVRKWDYEPMARGTFGGTVTITMWAPIMGAAQKIMGEKRREIREYFPPVGDALPSGITSDETAEDVATGKKDPSAVPGVVIGDGATTEPPSDGATGTEPPPQSRRTAREAEDGEVQLEICADSGLRATRYCPETIRRPFRVGGAPKGTCRLHGP